MSITKIKGFYAYSSSPEGLGESIERAVKNINRNSAVTNYITWRETNISGQFVINRILDKIRSCRVFVADISVLNFNVTYELGYAIGKRRNILLTINKEYFKERDEFSKLGLFDTIGYNTYTNSSELAAILEDGKNVLPLYSYKLDINRKTPVFMLGALYNSDSMSRLQSCAKKARLFYRSFDPNEQMRISCDEAIRHVDQSIGLIVPLLPPSSADSKLHNLRCAFFAGLGAAMDKVVLLLQSGDAPIPLDYRDLVKIYKFPHQIDQHVHVFAVDVHNKLSGYQKSIKTSDKQFLHELDLGASAAENEISVLKEYYLKTDEYRRALRGEGRLVKGRKGTGKSAVFFMVRNAIRSERNKIVLDLKPEGYQLLSFKERVLKMLDRGTLEHTVTAFWEYVLLIEVCVKIIREERKYHEYDYKITKTYDEMYNRYSKDVFISEGDFAERLLKLTKNLEVNYSGLGKSGIDVTLNSAEITGIIYRHDLDIIKNDILKFMKYKEGLWILIDNLDKGWPTHGLEDIDLLIIKCLLDASRKIEKWIEKRDFECHTIVFLRNDVYELLVRETADRGKEFVISVDWQDADLLREMLRKRIMRQDKESSFEELWSQIFITHIRGEETSQYLIDRSLMRPRYLINLINHCKSISLNLNHEKIEESDIDKGVSLYSKDCVSEINLEIQDVLKGIDALLYIFTGCEAIIEKAEVERLIKGFLGVTERNKTDQIIEILMWFGVFGVVRDNEDIAYTYTVDYDMRRLKAIQNKRNLDGKCILYHINPAFWSALEINSQGHSFELGS